MVLGWEGEVVARSRDVRRVDAVAEESEDGGVDARVEGEQGEDVVGTARAKTGGLRRWLLGALRSMVGL